MNDASASPAAGRPADIAANLETVRRAIAEAASSSGRDSDSVTLVAVGKTHGPEAIHAAISAGQRIFGENRVQEAKAKFPPLRETVPDLELHLIGPLQTNKVKEAVALFDVIQTVDRPKLARALADEMEKSGIRPRLLVQVNTGAEPQKAGVPPDELEGFLRLCRDECGLAIEGLMCIPPADEEPALHFALLADMARRHNLKTLSMGMSGDYETAIRFGCTHVRVGTAIFGSRPPVAAAGREGGAEEAG
jgi:PLP dependent protein